MPTERGQKNPKQRTNQKHTISIARPSQIAEDLPEVAKTKSMLQNKNTIVCLTSY